MMFGAEILLSVLTTLRGFSRFLILYVFFRYYLLSAGERIQDIFTENRLILIEIFIIIIIWLLIARFIWNFLVGGDRHAVLERDTQKTDSFLIALFLIGVIIYDVGALYVGLGSVNLAFKLSLALLFFIQYFVKNCIVENGIRVNTRLIRWENIQSYDWIIGDEIELHIETNTPIIFLHPLKLKIYRFQQEEIKLLIQRLL